MYQFLHIAVDLQQEFSTPVCPGDNVSFICTVSGSDALIMVWLNPENNKDKKIYQANDTDIDNDDVVGAFTTKLVEASNNTIVSTATIIQLNPVDFTSAGISCDDGTGNNKRTLYVADSGWKVRNA